MHITIKVLSFLLLIVLVLSLASCRNAEPSDTTAPETTAGEPDPQYGTVTAQDRIDKKIKILLDAGHGFGDVGCQSPFGFVEKDLTLLYVQKLEKLLSDMGVEVFLTHDGAFFPSIKEITDGADKYGISYDSKQLIENSVFSAYERSVWENVIDSKEHIDLFLSVHINSIENMPEMKGPSLDYYVGNPQAGSVSDICEQLKADLEKKFECEVRLFRDSYEEAYKVNKLTNTPSVLLECGYATNEKEAKNLQNADWQDSFLKTVAESIVESLKDGEY